MLKRSRTPCFWPRNEASKARRDRCRGAGCRCPSRKIDQSAEREPDALLELFGLAEGGPIDIGCELFGCRCHERRSARRSSAGFNRFRPQALTAARLELAAARRTPVIWSAAQRFVTTGGRLRLRRAASAFEQLDRCRRPSRSPRPRSWTRRAPRSEQLGRQFALAEDFHAVARARADAGRRPAPRPSPACRRRACRRRSPSGCGRG